LSEQASRFNVVVVYVCSGEQHPRAGGITAVASIEVRDRAMVVGFFTLPISNARVSASPPKAISAFAASRRTPIP
jgi:hypothetical protein